MRDVTAKNTVGAQLGDEVKFNLPDMIDVLAMYKHILLPLLISFIGFFALRSLLTGALQSLGGLVVNAVALLLAVALFAVAKIGLLRSGLIKKSSGSYNITITAITKPNNSITL